MAHESLMIGPNPGFWVNGPTLTVPGCDKHLIIVDAVYNRPDTVLESYAHRLESTMSYLTSVWDTSERFRHWERFAALNRTTRESGQPFCGNAHYPFNFRFEYDTTNTTAASSTCADWKNFPDYTGTTGSYSCTAWGCDNRGWQKHWFGSLPNRAGTITITGATSQPLTIRTDWWYYLLYPENAIAFVVSELTPSPTPFGLADINFDGVVDVWDARAGSPPDQNLDTYMNFFDFAAIKDQIP